MTRPEAASGGIAALPSVFERIELFLGELWGNQAAWEVAQEERRWVEQGQSERGVQSTVSVIHGAVQIPGTYGFPMAFEALDGQGDAQRPDGRSSGVEGAVEQKILAAWKDGTRRASGLASYYRSLTTTVWEPDADALRAAASRIGDVTHQLYAHIDDTTPAFVSDLQKSWPGSSLGSASFYRFWEDQADLCNQYLLGANVLGVTAAAATGAVESYQDMLVEISKAAYEGVRDALQNWAHFRGPDWQVTKVVENEDLSSEILSGTSFVTGILGTLPTPAAGPLDAVSVVTGVVGHYRSMKSETITIAYVEADAATADFEEALATCARELGAALDGLRSESVIGSGTGSEGVDFPTFVKDAETNPNWKPLEVEIDAPEV